MLVIKTNTDVVLEINSSSSADNREDTSDLKNFFRNWPIKVIFYFKIRWLVTLKFKDVLTGNEARKHLRGSGETAKEK